MLADAEVFGQVTPGVGYSVSQAVPAGWDLTSATCDDGSPVANIDVDAGEEINCTFTDQKRGRVVVVVDAVPNDAQDFSFTAGGGLTPTSVSLDDDSDGTLPNSATLNDVPTGSGYSLSQSRCPPVGIRRAPPAATAARSATSAWARTRLSPAPSRTTSADRSWSSRTRSRTTHRTSPSPRVAG